MLKPVLIEHNIEIAAPAEAVFTLYKDVERWSDWDSDIANSQMDGEFEIGTRGFLVPSKGYGVQMELTEVTEGRSFTVVSKIPMLRMKFDHEIEPSEDYVVVTHRVKFEGLLSMFLGKRLASQIDQGMPVTLANLKTMVEIDVGAKPT